jgi:hypothetical protein
VRSIQANPEKAQEKRVDSGKVDGLDCAARQAQRLCMLFNAPWLKPTPSRPMMNFRNRQFVTRSLRWRPWRP